MASIYSLQNNRAEGRVSVVRSVNFVAPQFDERNFSRNDVSVSLRRFNEFWELMETIRQHGYLRAAMSVVGRSAVGAWWTIRRHPEFGDVGTEDQRRFLMNFYLSTKKQWDNIKDYQTIAYKLMIAVMYLRYFGQAAFYIVRDKDRSPLGLDFLPGMVVPNTNKDGSFKSPAFIQYPSSDPAERVEFENPNDIVYMVNPDWEGSPLGGSDIEALSTYVLPVDLYLMTGAREYLKNRDRPEVVYSLPADISDEAFDEFVNEMAARRAGPTGLGRNPIAIQGELGITELKPLPDALPYQDSRQDALDEELAVAGVSGAKLGLSRYMTNANLRELRREFHETGLVPLFTMAELAFYEQINVREYNCPGWQFKFNSPDFLNAVERATVDMRYWQIGTVTPNEIRYGRGLPARTDPLGDMYRDQLNSVIDDLTDDDPQGDITMPGSPPEGREDDPGSPSNVGEPGDTGVDPVRGDQHDEGARQSMLRELRQWRTVALRRAKDGKAQRLFRSDALPDELRALIQGQLDSAAGYDEIRSLFQDIFSVIDDISRG